MRPPVEISTQINVAPLALVVDRRARQVFVGFTARAVREALGSGYPDTTAASVGDSRLVLSDLPEGVLNEVTVEPLESENPGGLAGLVWLVDRLLGPGGCPWDQEQTHKSLCKYLIEESYELIEAIQLENAVGMKEELGDVLLQPIMHAQMSKRDGGFDVHEVADGTVRKLIHRHPHVFGESKVSDTAGVLAQWDTIKKAERSSDQGILSGVPKTMPSLLRAHEISKRAARSGFEWPDIDGVWDKFHEEEAELKAAWASGVISDVQDELGDLLFTIVNLARWMGVDAEESLRLMLNRFQARFEHMERAAGKPLKELSPMEWDDHWTAAKLATRPTE